MILYTFLPGERLSLLLVTFRLLLHCQIYLGGESMV